MTLLIVSDLHGNPWALSAVLAAEPACDGFLCLGDLVNYGPDPMACVDWARSAVPPGRIVQGNHDHALGLDADPRCSAPYQPLAAAMQRYTAGVLTPEARHYLAGLPPTLTPTFGGARFFLCHAAPSDPLFAYVPPDEPEARWEAEVECAGRPDFLLVGHTHLQFTLRIGSTVVVNPGSVGQPKGGDPRACYAVWHDGEVSFRRVAYDVHATVRGLAACAPPTVVLALTRVLLTGGDLPAGIPS
jgi:predicted phosphodiesterase